MATKNIHFESELGALKAILQSVERKFLEIEKHNKELGCAEKTKPNIDLLNKGKELVEKCSEISPLNFIERRRYSDELTGYKAALLSFCQVELQLEQSSDIKEMLMKLDRLDRISEVVKDWALFSPSLHPVIGPYSALLKCKDEVLIKDRPAAVLLATCRNGTATSPEIQESELDSIPI
ncbi:hypothetical protein RJ640_011626 [Escallonia rubra]|uniref:RPW8 domain-containing protein n=1 Tax=Escallonia rubra TaxID=112253 RepID=A0AA88RBV5_9ASTE|nr:hypothetical protein RJ640_011626 [Escallonia rubra]